MSCEKSSLNALTDGDCWKAGAQQATAAASRMLEAITPDFLKSGAGKQADPAQEVKESLADKLRKSGWTEHRDIDSLSSQLHGEYMSKAPFDWTKDPAMKKLLESTSTSDIHGESINSAPNSQKNLEGGFFQGHKFVHALSAEPGLSGSPALIENGGKLPIKQYELGKAKEGSGLEGQSPLHGEYLYTAPLHHLRDLLKDDPAFQPPQVGTDIQLNHRPKESLDHQDLDRPPSKK